MSRLCRKYLVIKWVFNFMCAHLLDGNGMIVVIITINHMEIQESKRNQIIKRVVASKFRREREIIDTVVRGDEGITCIEN